MYIPITGIIEPTEIEILSFQYNIYFPNDWEIIPGEDEVDK